MAVSAIIGTPPWKEGLLTVTIDNLLTPSRSLKEIIWLSYASRTNHIHRALDHFM